MSLGAWMGLRFAIRSPERVDALSLISASGLAAQRWSFIVVALPLTMLGAWGLRRVNRLVFDRVEIPTEVEEFMMLVGRHFRPMLEPVPVFGDAELRRLRGARFGPYGAVEGRPDGVYQSTPPPNFHGHWLPGPPVPILAVDSVTVVTTMVPTADELRR
jgi:pimeloyl-ACP methyl ester carboxylesterase